jgi:hypothetical protein
VSDAVTISLIGGVVTILGALITYLTVITRLRHARKNPGKIVNADIEVRDAEERYGADPRLFVADIMADRKEYREEVKSLRAEVGGLGDELQRFRETDRRFRNALARWFVDIMAKFQEHGIPMPYPIDTDRDILADVIPSTLEATQPRPPYTPLD